MIGIYMYENKKNHKKYIGQSVNIERRRKEHINWPSKYSRFDNELRVIGEENFIFSILEECSYEDLDDREKYWIDFFNTQEDGYNLTPGGQNYRGESNPSAKLKNEDVQQIIILLEELKLNNFQIAKLFNVHHNTIDFINRCKTWTHLHNYNTNIRQENLKLLKFPHSTTEGENSPTSKITEKQAITIINLLKTDSRSLAQIARDEKISLNIIYDINRCKTWKYLHKFKKNIRNEYRKESDAKNED